MQTAMALADRSEQLAKGHVPDEAPAKASPSDTDSKMSPGDAADKSSHDSSSPSDAMNSGDRATSQP